jgi:plasmid stabilization system protein ParE
MGYQVVLSPCARADLRGIVRYISADAPETAIRFGQFLVSRTKMLADFPEMGRVVPETGEQRIREIIVRSYRIVYRLDHAKRIVEVIRFWHAARGTPKINE